MLSATVNVANSAQICLKTKLWNTTKNWDFSVFQKKNNSMYRRGTSACFYFSDFQSKNFSYAISIVKKRPLYVNFSIPPFGNWWVSQGSTPRVDMRFCGHVPNSPRNKNLSPSIHTYSKNRFFWTPKDCCPPFAGARKTFLQL
jgi:hypothetical protein